jgi:hypothetical protein
MGRGPFAISQTEPFKAGILGSSAQKDFAYSQTAGSKTVVVAIQI